MLPRFTVISCNRSAYESGETPVLRSQAVRSQERFRRDAGVTFALHALVILMLLVCVQAKPETLRSRKVALTATPVSFQFDVLPVLTKQGCATGSCHGSPHGKGGFSLSLFGYDPRIDRVSLTRDGYNRRINVLEPDESLILKKPLLRIPHVGGRRLRRTDIAFRILHDWVEQGAKTDLSSVECVSISVTPRTAQVLDAANREQSLRVLAAYSDGTRRDVTSLATFESSHPSLVKVDGSGRVTGLARGQAAVSVRYLQHLQSVYFTFIETVPGFAWKPQSETNFIDRLVNAKLKQLQYLPSGDCGDTGFLRRVSLDLTGLLPTAERTRRFLADRSPARRTKLIDELLATEEFARFQALKKADLMRVSLSRLKDGRAETFGRWLVEAMRTNMPWNRFATTLLTSSGDTLESAPANYFLAIPTTEERAEMTAQLFMGTRIECAKCHNHPFENWTMRDYYRIGAVFARTQVEKDVVKLADTGETENPSTHEKAIPWAMTVAGSASDTKRDRRAVFADWLTKPGNPYFARVEVNRIWADLMGRGIVEPVDDFRSSNPPSNVPLLDALAREFERSGYDRKHIFRLVCNSRAYQRSAETNRLNEADERLFSHARVRLLTAEQLKDAIGYAARVLPPPSTQEQATAAARRQLDEYSSGLERRGATGPGKEKDQRLKELREQLSRYENRMDYATQRPYPQATSFTTAFGQPARETACTCERQSSPTLLQALELLNGGTAYEMVKSGAGRYAGLNDRQVVEEIYLSALCRYPSEKETRTAERYLARSLDRNTGITDLLWTVVNTREFLFQH